MSASADDWRHQAACLNYEPDLFHPVGNTIHAAAQAEEAKAACRSCWVREHCLQYALEQRIDSGVWGGLTEHERRRIHHRKTARAHTGRTA